MPRSSHELERLTALLILEEEAVELRQAELHEGKTAKALEQAGSLIRKAPVINELPAMLGRTRVILGEDSSRKGHLALFNARPGAVVRYDARSDDETIEVRGVVTRRGRGRIEIVFDEPPEHDGVLDVALSADPVTAGRLRHALKDSDDARGRTATLVDVVLCAEPPRPRGEVDWAPFDEALNEDQREAAQLGVFAPDVALVHGPPGTGKTRVLVEVVRQCVARGERVLCAAASNAAVDHLAIELLAADGDLPLARAGHPARVQQALEAHTLAALTEQHPQRKLAEQLFAEAHKLLRGRRSDRGGHMFERRREAKREANTMFADARRLERQAADDVIERARVVCGTLTGFRSYIGKDAMFDVLVVDEASQVITPALLLGVLRAKRVVFAGDHQQLPPTIISQRAEREGLGRTAFDALMRSDDATPVRHMLTVQHRMHGDLMAFSSAEFYDGLLRAHPSVATRCLDDRPLDVIDTAGASMDELADEQTSRSNPSQAELTARLTRQLLEQGLAADEIGVVTPYAGQVAILLGLLDDLVEAGLEVDSVDGFQGREKEAIVFDAVRSNTLGEVGFLSDHRRLNVAITRAKQKLIVVADSATVSTDPLWNRFFDHAMATGAYRSVFELVD